jgi:hypothetical protein
MTRRQFSNLGLRLFYSGNITSYCPGTFPLAAVPPACIGRTAVAPALAAPPTITGVESTFDGGILTVRARVVGDPIAGIQTAWVTWTIPPGAAATGTWQSFDLIQDEDDATLWTGTLATTTPGQVNFLVQAVNGVGKVTVDDNLGAFYRHGAIPGPIDPDDPPTGTALAITSSVPASVPFRQAFDVTVRLTSTNGATCPVDGRRVRIGLGGALLPATTNASGDATVTVLASLSPGTYPLTATFAGTENCAPSDDGDTVVVTRRPTTLTLSVLGPQAPVVATLRASTTPVTPLHQRNVFIVVTGPSTTEVHAGKTDPLGQVALPASLISSLAPGSYQIDAYFNGVNRPDVPLVAAPDDVDYGPSQATATFTRWPFSGFFAPVDNPPTVNVVNAGRSIPVVFGLGGNRGLAIFAAGYPRVLTVPCEGGAPTDAIETTTAGSSGLQYNASTNRYTYVWKTEKSWKGCRTLVLRFVDGTEVQARFRLT